MDLATLITGGVLCIIPISELRGGLPVVLSGGMHPLLAYLYCVFLNSLVTPLVLLFLATVNKLLMRFNWYKKFYNKIIERTRNKLQKKVEKWGILGIVIFVAVPLPFTGAYTGALGGWLFGMDMKKVFLAVTLGVSIAGLLIMGAYYLAGLGYDFFKVFFK